METWMTEAAAEFATKIRNEGLNKKQTREVTGLSERKTRQLHDFVMGLTDEEAQEFAAPAEAEATEAKEEATPLSPLKRAVRDYRREKLSTGDLTTLVEHHLSVGDPKLAEILDKRASHFEVESAGYKWIDVRVEVPTDEMESIDEHLAANLKTHGKLAPAKYYKANKLETGDGNTRFTFQIRVY